ncbi:amidohydrolase family protein [Nocardioides sp. cx-169]|uniref:amidohydrolase family protein n=1 Tax=Nocardioides sp. cx-169 TaxID=2899080 RepID=UPI001E4ECC80|nr:amidohydrolase family protein [Nocardioides sp. cx-169]MCD4535073.1 amidohydrolase family protein [Nocardioides sp. cx-169]
MSILLRHVEVDGRGVDVRITGSRIEAIAPHLDALGSDVVDGRGGALIAGLADHHLHLFAMAAELRSVRCSPAAVGGLAGLAAALSAAPADVHGWVRGVAYHEDVAGLLDAQALDRIHRDRPVRIQHSSGAVWFLNSAAIRATGLAAAHHPAVERDATGRPTGRVWRADDLLRSLLPAGDPPSLREVSRRLARFGIVAVTDATPRLDQERVDLFRAALASGELAQHVTLLGAPLGVDLQEPLLAAGPWKIVLADSELPGIDDLVSEIREAHSSLRPVAAHCVTSASLFLFLAALDEAGTLPGDRIEHAAVVPAPAIGMLAERNLRVVTQPGFLPDRGDRFAAGTPRAEHGDLYRCRSLLDRGIPVAMSSDAPYGPLDPWQVIAAAVDRLIPGGHTLGASEALTPARALESYLTPTRDPGGTPRRLSAGGAADLVLLHQPLGEALREPSCEQVNMVFVRGVPAT